MDMGSVNRVLAGLLPDDFKSYLTKTYPDWEFSIRKGEIRIRVWSQRLGTELIKLIFMSLMVCLIYIVCLYYLGGIWTLFENTFIGSQYIARVDAARAAEISWFFSQDVKVLGVAIIFLTMLSSLVVAVFSQLILLRRFFYVGRSFLVKLGWSAIVSAAAAQRLAEYYPIDFAISFGLCFLPTIFIFSSFIAASGRLLPELNVLLFIENWRGRKDVQGLKDDIAQLMSEESEQDFDQ